MNVSMMFLFFESSEEEKETQNGFGFMGRSFFVVVYFSSPPFSPLFSLFFLILTLSKGEKDCVVFLNTGGEKQESRNVRLMFEFRVKKFPTCLKIDSIAILFCDFGK